ncbi:MAG: TenA family protein [Haloferacaceae archaeon]
MSEAVAFDPDAGERFSDWLRDRTDWTDATRHRFVEEVRRDAVDDAVFGRYLVADYAFLEAGARKTARTASQAPTIEEMGRHAESLSVLTGGEHDYFLRAFDELGIPEERRRDPDLPSSVEAFIDFLYRATDEGGYEESLAVEAAAEWVYLDWCAYAAEGAPDRWVLAEWLDVHRTDWFESYVGWLRERLDEYGPRLSPRRRRRVARLFERTVAHETAFFDAAYDPR